MKADNNIDTYIKANSIDILIYVFLLIVITMVLPFVCYTTHWYYILLIDIFILNSLISRVKVKYNLNKIDKYLKDNDLVNKIGKIEYWNEKNYFLTENCVIIFVDKKVRIFSYSDIASISKKNDVKLKSYSRLDEYLAIMLLNDEQYRILLYITVLTNGKYKDISDFLLNKNNNIIKKQVL